MYIPSNKIYIDEVEGKGLGVFALIPIKKDELIETCPLMSLGKNPGNKHQDPFFNYRFAHPRSNRHNGNEDQVVAWGYGSLYNHSNNPNCIAKIINASGNHVICIYAMKDINVGDEITFNYHHASDDTYTQPEWLQQDHN